MGTSSQLFFIFESDLYFLLFYLAVCVLFLVLCFILVPYSICGEKFIVVSLFKGTLLSIKIYQNFEKRLFWGFPLRGVPHMGGCEILTVKVKLSVA